LQFVSFGFERLEGLVSPVKKSVDLSWDAAGHGSIATTQNETDTVLLDLLPALGNLCCDGALAVNQQHEEKAHQISWSHRIVVSGLCRAWHGDGRRPGARIAQFCVSAEAARRSFDKYMAQLKWALDTPLPTMPRREVWDENVRRLQKVAMFTKADVERTKNQEMLTHWNPLCAGMILSYLEYYGNLNGGMMMIDHGAQLRVTLHLYNALRGLNAIVPGQLAVLDWL
jgi:hypothetical protein